MSKFGQKEECASKDKFDKPPSMTICKTNNIVKVCLYFPMYIVHPY